MLRNRIKLELFGRPEGYTESHDIFEMSGCGL